MTRIFDSFLTRIKTIAESKWAPWILLGIATATRLIGAALGGTHSDDEDHTYSRMALEFLEGRGLSFEGPMGRVYSWLPPGMGMLNVVFYTLFGQTVWPVRLIFVLMSAVAGVALFYVGKKLLDAKFAFLVSLAWALYPPQWFWASRINSQTYATNMLVICLWLLLIGWETRKWSIPFLIGLIWVSMSLCRGEYALGLFVIAAVSLWAIKDRRQAVRFASLLVIGWVVGFAPWVIRNYHHHQRFLLISTNAGDAFWKAYNPEYNFSGIDMPFPPEFETRLRQETNEVERSRILKREGLKFIQENPTGALRNLIGNALNFWRPWLSWDAVSPLQNMVYLVSFSPIFLLFLWGLSRRPWTDPRWAVVVGLVVYKWLIHLPFYVIVRQREAIFPLIILIAGLGLERLFTKSNQEPTI